MSTIKPADGRAAADALDSALPAEGEHAERSGGPSFRETLAGPSPAQANREPDPAGVAASGASGSSVLAEAVRAGALTPDQAIEQLVERAAAAVSRSLSEAQRAELRAVLFEAVQSDPALRELREAIGPT